MASDGPCLGASKSTADAMVAGDFDWKVLVAIASTEDDFTLSVCGGAEGSIALYWMVAGYSLIPPRMGEPMRLRRLTRFAVEENRRLLPLRDSFLRLRWRRPGILEVLPCFVSEL